VSTAEVAILVSLLSLVIAVISLGWQVLAFQRSGYRVKCTLQMGFIETTQSDSSGPVLTTSAMASPKQWEARAAMRAHREQHFFLTVTNSGRAAVWVDSIGLTTKGTVIQVSLDPDEPELPYRLDSHQTQRWSIPAREPVRMIVGAIDTPSETLCTHGSVTLGDGKRMTTDEGVRLKLLSEVLASE
jgi:DNA-binding transcriptional regulator of glucitol operon